MARACEIPVVAAAAAPAAAAVAAVAAAAAVAATTYLFVISMYTSAAEYIFSMCVATKVGALILEGNLAALHCMPTVYMSPQH